MKNTIVFFLVWVSWVSMAKAAEPMNLDRVFAAAVTRSETILDQDEQIRQAGEHYRQALGSALPALSGVGSYPVQDTSSANAASSIYPNTQPLVKLMLTQPLFRGLREFKALKQTSLLEKAQVEMKRQAMLQLYYDVSQSFFTVLSLEKDLKNVKTEIELYEKRIKELNDRIHIGRSRTTEVLTVQTSSFALRAQVEQIIGQISAAREMFAFLTALAADTVLIDDRVVPTKVDSLDSHVSGLEGRPDVRAAGFKLDAASENVAIQRGSHFPSLDFTGNYYFKRFGSQEDVKWDVNLTLVVPIFSGGVINSKVGEAASQQMQGELALSKAKRMASEEIRTFYKNVESDLKQLEQLEATRDISEKNFVDQTKEYRLGLVNNLDVIQALTSFQESVRALERARFIGKLHVEKLAAASGKSAGLNLRPAN